MSAHFARDAALLAALPVNDPEVVAAMTHARGCAECARALDEGRRLMALLDAAPPPPPPSKEALARTAAAIATEIAAESAHARAPSNAGILIPVAAVVVAWALELAIAKRLASDSTDIAVSVALAAFAAALALASMKRPRVALVVAVAASAGMALAMGTAVGLEVKIGVKCTLLELVAGAIPWCASYVVARRSKTMFDPARAAGLAAAGALAGHAALHLACSVAHADAHLLVFHLGGVVIAPALAWVGARALGPRTSA